MPTIIEVQEQSGSSAVCIKLFGETEQDLKNVFAK